MTLISHISESADHVDPLLMISTLLSHSNECCGTVYETFFVNIYTLLNNVYVEF
jgi:hypothetical protein